MNGQNVIRVLLLDEDERFLTSTASALERRGFTTAIATNLAGADEIISRWAPDLVLVSSPPERTIEALRRLRTSLPAAKLITMTTDPLNLLAMGALGLGACDVLERPCNIDRLENRLKSLYAQTETGPPEPKTRDIMVPLYAFSTIREDRSVSEAIQTILQSFNRLLGSHTHQEAVHRSVLVMDRNAEIIGILTMADMLRGLGVPPGAPEQGGQETGGGMFTVISRDLAGKPVRDLMSAAPPVIDADTGLMDAAAAFVHQSTRRFLVSHHGKLVGVLREQDVFFEMAKVLKAA